MALSITKSGYAPFRETIVSSSPIAAAEAKNARMEGFRLATYMELLAVRTTNDVVRYFLSKERIITADNGVSAIGPCEIMCDGSLKEMNDRTIGRFYGLHGNRRAYATPGTGSVIVEWRPASNAFRIAAIPDPSISGIAIWLPNGRFAALARK